MSLLPNMPQHTIRQAIEDVRIIIRTSQCVDFPSAHLAIRADAGLNGVCPMVQGQAADLWARHKSRANRPPRCVVRIQQAVLLPEGDQGQTAQLVMELIDDPQTCSQQLYPHLDSHGLTTTKEWNAALVRAKWVAEHRGHGIPHGCDVRWRIVNSAGITLGKSVRLEGPSAGGGFLAGLVALSLMTTRQIHADSLQWIENLIFLVALPHKNDKKGLLVDLGQSAVERKLALPWRRAVQFVLPRPMAVPDPNQRQVGHLCQSVEDLVTLVERIAKSSGKAYRPTTITQSTMAVVAHEHQRLANGFPGKVESPDLVSALTMRFPGQNACEIIENAKIQGVLTFSGGHFKLTQQGRKLMHDGNT
jgi:hypothetical protein